MNKKLAKISGANLTMERDILSFRIYVNYEEGGAQGIGGLALDGWDEEKKDRVGTKYGCEMIRRLLIEMKVNDFSQMKGIYVYVYGEGEGFGFKPKGISRLNVDKKKSGEPLMFDDVYKEFG